MITVHIIYGLTNEHGLVCYVGQTTNCERRFMEHVARPPARNVSIVGLAILAAVSSRDEANQCESRWIQFFGRHSLLNKDNGGHSIVGKCEMSADGLYLARKTARLTKPALAKKLMVTPDQIARWENGEESIPGFVKTFFTRRNRRKVSNASVRYSGGISS